MFRMHQHNSLTLALVKFSQWEAVSDEKPKTVRADSYCPAGGKESSHVDPGLAALLH